MALIEYRIVVENGNATVIQDVQELDAGDRIRFVTDDSTTVIVFSDQNGPVANPAPGVNYAVPLIPAQGAPPVAEMPVTTPSTQAPFLLAPEIGAGEMRNRFTFTCGRLIDGAFAPWGGGGGTTPGGGPTGP